MTTTILDFWFQEATPQQWFTKDPDFDETIRSRFGEVLRQATACELFGWRTSPRGRLAEIIVLDQFSRNMFRDTPGAFAQDPLALALAQEAVASGDDQTLSQTERNFLYMPYMHSESLVIHDAGLKLFEANGDANALKFEIAHRDIIVKFGRYPHRNAILGRESTPEEQAFLKQPNSGF